ncbi:MAG: hypothetical protein M1820_010113 [Bogoriella megaspora]|nr:MAG: hypothetical protein M1820_010113 [Bogoriella megaspora]
MAATLGPGSSFLDQTTSIRTINTLKTEVAKIHDKLNDVLGENQRLKDRVETLEQDNDILQTENRARKGETDVHEGWLHDLEGRTLNLTGSTGSAPPDVETRVGDLEGEAGRATTALQTLTGKILPRMQTQLSELRKASPRRETSKNLDTDAISKLIEAKLEDWIGAEIGPMKTVRQIQNDRSRVKGDLQNFRQNFNHELDRFEARIADVKLADDLARLSQTTQTKLDNLDSHIRDTEYMRQTVTNMVGPKLTMCYNKIVRSKNEWNKNFAEKLGYFLTGLDDILTRLTELSTKQEDKTALEQALKDFGALFEAAQKEIPEHDPTQTRPQTGTKPQTKAQPQTQTHSRPENENQQAIHINIRQTSSSQATPQPSTSGAQNVGQTNKTDRGLETSQWNDVGKGGKPNQHHTSTARGGRGRGGGSGSGRGGGVLDILGGHQPRSTR